MKAVTISVLSNDKTIKFAADELKKYLSLLDADIDAVITSDVKADCITVGLWDKEETDTDTTVVDMDGLCGKISGSNPRSVLFAVYQYLEAVGVRWVRHGADGEYIPTGHDFAKDSIHFTNTAKQKHRCMMIEGSLSRENIMDNIDWCAKMGFNQYYIQFYHPTYFFRRWYEHQFNPLLEKQILTEEEYIDIHNQMIKEIKKRGMLLYVVGHGWHSRAHGLTPDFNALTDEQKSILAEINGKREYFEGLGGTQLCYSQDKVRTKIVDYVIDYLKEHPEADYLMFPLADGCNNHCECTECRKYTPSDLYVMLFNELDEAMTKNGFKQKVAVCIYCDYMWPPETVKFNNPDRFLYCYAPFFRINDTSYKHLGELPKLPPYTRNKLRMLSEIGEIVASLKAWQDHQFCEGYAHEYYYYVGEHYADFGSLHMAKVIQEDIQCLRDLKLDGMMSCQSQRAFCPTGFGSYVMAKALWDDSFDFDELKKEYFDAAFGEQSDVFNKYLSYLSETVHSGDSVPYDKAIAAAEKMAEYIKTLDLNSMNPCAAASIKYINFHCGLVIRHSEAESAFLKDGYKASEDKWIELFNYVRVHELEVQPVFDLQQYFMHFTRLTHDVMPLFEDVRNDTLAAEQIIVLQ